MGACRRAGQGDLILDVELKTVQQASWHMADIDHNRAVGNRYVK